jgi:alkylation response protein AidB-like acyl-CoA dehydrogenase
MWPTPPSVSLPKHGNRGGAGFYRGFGLERLFRDIQAARYHPLPENEQVKFSGEYLLRD